MVRQTFPSGKGSLLEGAGAAQPRRRELKYEVLYGKHNNADHHRPQPEPVVR